MNRKLSDKKKYGWRFAPVHQLNIDLFSHRPDGFRTNPFS